MRVTAQSNVEMQVQQSSVKVKPAETTRSSDLSSEVKVDVKISTENANALSSKQEAKVNREDLDQAVDTMNELLETTHKASKFVLHDGLDKYFVRLVDAETEEVIKEIPPERLLDAFYQMQKLAGMIVDEKI